MRKLTEEQVNLVCEQYKNGLSTPKLGKQYGVSHKTIMRAIKRKGFLLRGISKSLQRYCLDETVFDVITEESAYWLGFLMADGNICHTKQGSPLISLCLHRKDEQHLIHFRSFLGSDHPLTRGANNSLKLNIRSTLLAKRLQKYGILPRKSLVAKVSTDLLFNRHFWRGVVDGDGSIGIYSSNKSRYHNKPCFSLVGSKDLMNQFIEFSKEYSPDENIKTYPIKNISRISLRDDKAKTMIDILYNNCSIALPRKLNAAKNIAQLGALCRQPRKDVNMLNFVSHIPLKADCFSCQ